jgi:antitoxin VapB
MDNFFPRSLTESRAMATTAERPTPRRQQRGVTIRSDHALARLALLTRDGRSQVEVIEEALDRMPLPKPLIDRAAHRARIEEILARVPKRAYPTMAELDAENFDEEGNCR